MLRKKLDKSSFLHRGTAIPKAMAEMFGNPKETKDVVIQASGKLFEAKVKVFPNGRLQLIWKAEFAKFLQEKFPEAFEAIKSGNDDVEMPSMIIEPTEIKTVFGISFTSQFRIQLTQ